MTAETETMTGNPEALVNARGQTHGPWRDQLELAQRLKMETDLRHSKRWEDVFENGGGVKARVIRECQESILLKISRIRMGDPFAVEHWEDIAGYAAIALKELNRK